MIQAIQAMYGIKKRIREQWIDMSKSSRCKVLINYHIHYNKYIIEYNYHMMHAMDLGRSDG
jgi:hypothetical protein